MTNTVLEKAKALIEEARELLVKEEQQIHSQIDDIDQALSNYKETTTEKKAPQTKKLEAKKTQKKRQTTKKRTTKWDIKKVCSDIKSKMENGDLGEEFTVRDIATHASYPNLTDRTNRNLIKSLVEKLQRDNVMESTGTQRPSSAGGPPLNLYKLTGAPQATQTTTKSDEVERLVKASREKIEQTTSPVSYTKRELAESLGELKTYESTRYFDEVMETLIADGVIRKTDQVRNVVGRGKPGVVYASATPAANRIVEQETQQRESRIHAGFGVEEGRRREE